MVGPSHTWDTTTLRELTEDGLLTDGDWVETKDQDPDGDVRLIQLADVGEGAFRDRSNRFLTSNKATELNCTFLQAGDLLIARMPEPLGRACIFPGDPKPSVTAVDVCVVRPRDDTVDRKWLMWIVNTPQFRSKIASLQSGTTRKRISRKNLSFIEFPLPPRHVQERIRDEVDQQFSRLDAAVAALQRAQINLKLYEGSIIEASVNGDLDGRTMAEAPRVDRGDGWSLVEFGTLLREPLRNGHSAKRSVSGEGIRTLTLTAVTQRDFSERNTKVTAANPDRVKALWLEPGDILIERSNTAELVGTAAIFDGPPNYAIFPDLLIRARVKHDVTLGFLDLVLRSHGTRKYFRSRAQGIAGSMPKIDQTTVLELPVPLPPTRERQEKIVEEADRQISVVDSLSKEVQEGLQRAEATRRAILRDAFSGRLLHGDRAGPAEPSAMSP